MLQLTSPIVDPRVGFLALAEQLVAPLQPLVLALAEGLSVGVLVVELMVVEAVLGSWADLEQV